MTSPFRRALFWWQNRLARSAMFRAVPELRELDRKEALYRRDHKRGAARITKAKRDAVCRAMAGITRAEWEAGRDAARGSG